MGPADPVDDDGDDSMSRPLFAIGTIRGRRQPVMVLHPALIDGVVNRHPRQEPYGEYAA
jgi:hypothetical protein